MSINNVYLVCIYAIGKMVFGQSAGEGKNRLFFTRKESRLYRRKIKNATGRGSKGK